MRSSPARSLRCWIPTLHAQAVAQVQALKREFSEDAGASARRKRATAERVARDRQERLRWISSSR